VYNAASIPQIMNEPTMNPGDTLNIDLSISIVCISFLFLGFTRLMMMISKTIETNVIAILSKNG
jgi:hypothetical protein